MGAGGFSPPVGQQTQYLQIQPNTGNNTTTRFTSLPYLSSSDYNFPAQTGTISSISPGNNNITMTPVPLGVNGSDGHHKLWVSGGTGTAEACTIVGGSGTSGQTSGVITLSCSNSHSGAFTVSSGTVGIEEAIIQASNMSTPYVVIPAGDYTLHTGVYIQAGMSDGRLTGIGVSLAVASGFTGEIVTGDASLFGFTLEGFEVNCTNCTGTGNIINLSRPENSVQDKVSKIRVDFAPVGSIILNMDGDEDSTVEDTGLFNAAGSLTSSSASISWHVPAGNIHVTNVTTFGYLLFSYQIATIVQTTSGPLLLDGANLTTVIDGGYMYGGLQPNNSSYFFYNISITGTIMVLAQNQVAFVGTYDGTVTFQGLAYAQATPATLFGSTTLGSGAFFLYGGPQLYANGATQGTPNGPQIGGFQPGGITSIGYNFISTETGANNAVVGSTLLVTAPLPGMCVTMMLSHSLQTGGVNTAAINGSSAIEIRSHYNPANLLSTHAYISGGIINMCLYSGGYWLDMSQ